MDKHLSAEAERVLSWFTPTKSRAVNSTLTSLTPYRELVTAGLLTETALGLPDWYKYELALPNLTEAERVALVERYHRLYNVNLDAPRPDRDV